MQEGMKGLQDFRYALQKFRKDCENFSRIAKISQGLRKFRNHSENFAIPAKFSLCTFFRYDSKISLS